MVGAVQRGSDNHLATRARSGVGSLFNEFVAPTLHGRVHPCPWAGGQNRVMRTSTRPRARCPFACPRALGGDDGSW